MIKAIIITISIAALIICACGLIQEWRKAQARRRERICRKRYLKRFRKNQRECDEMFRELEYDRQEAELEKQKEERRREKWDKQSFTSHNPELEVFLNGVVI